MRVSNIFSPLFVKQEKLFVNIRDFKKEDANGIVELIRKNYADTYYRKGFYDANMWIKAYNEKRLIPIIAEYQGKIVGQFSLILNDKYNAEIGIAVVHPDFKGRGIMNQMFDYLIKKAKSIKLYAIYGEAIMFHPFSQKANLSHSMVETALHFGEVAHWISQKEFKFEKRSGVLISYLLFKKEKRNYYLPEIYKKIMLERIKKLKITVTKTKIKRIKPKLELKVKKILKIAIIRADSRVKNFEKKFNFIFSKAKIKADMIYLDINLHSHYVEKIVEFASKKGFFYSGILFYRYDGMDYLRLQFENRHKIEEKLNVCYSKYCKKLTKFILKDKKRVNKLN
ncbi:GNAT family N-acetyltransferase [Lebetimonas sp. JS032]|uniref:GNAT family N-acetyltransferase n=1 Tax=Lebetimonas sp. JS032 TaxID=990070 RepID=UPI000466ACA0|nr:GNAT family N-acetyltransferase [Lebetimonas sp. JS032]